MKKLIYLFVFISFLLSNTCLGDVIIINVRYVEICAKITNLTEYPEVSLLGFIPGPTKFDTYIISPSECLSKGYSGNFFHIYALNKEYLKGKDINKLDLFNDPNALKSNIQIDNFGTTVRDSSFISSIEQYYRIVGFSETSVIIYKWKEVTMFNNGRTDFISTYTYDGDTSKLYQKIQVGVNSKQNTSSIDVFPNPAQKNFHLKMNNSYHGSVSIQLINLDGKVVKSQKLTKTAQILDTDIHVENLAVGSYYVSIKFGKLVESKKIVIK